MWLGTQPSRNYNQQDHTLDKIKDIIIRTVSPDKIILFGSRARGEAKSNSDYDILIIKDGLKNERILTRKINYELINEHILFLPTHYNQDRS